MFIFSSKGSKVRRPHSMTALGGHNVSSRNGDRVSSGALH